MDASSVEIITLDEQYLVRVVENGEVTEQKFTALPFAQAFAKGQRIRLHCDDLIAQDQAQVDRYNPSLCADY